MSEFVSILLAALLFASFGLVRHRKGGCGGECGTCTGPCALEESVDADH